MNDAFLMRRFESVDYLDGKVEYPFKGKGTLLNQVLQRFAFQQFHGDEQSAALFGDLVNCADVGMI